MSCLFDSLSAFVIETSGSELRQVIVNYLRTNPKLIDEISFDDMMQWEEIEEDVNSSEEYIKWMSNDNTWGGGIEIRAFCRLYNCRVDVHNPLLGKIIHFYPSDCTETVVDHALCAILWTGNHFVPIGNIVKHLKLSE